MDHIPILSFYDLTPDVLTSIHDRRGCVSGYPVVFDTCRRPCRDCSTPQMPDGVGLFVMETWWGWEGLAIMWEVVRPYMALPAV